MKPVVAVENAFCAFSKELVGAFWASTAPAASTAFFLTVRLERLHAGKRGYHLLSQRSGGR